MNSIQKIGKVILFHFKRELFSQKNIFLYVLMGIFIYSNMDGVVRFCTNVGLSASPAGYVFLMNDFIFQTTFLIGLLFLFSHAPFRDNMYRYIVYRTGSMCWEIGTILYMVLMSLIYLFYIIGVSFLALKGNLEFTMEWGKVWGTLAKTTAAEVFQIPFTVSPYIIGKYSPAYGMLISALLEWLCFVWLALCTYFCNVRIKKGAGILAAGVFIFLDTMISNSWAPWAYHFSPVTLAQLSNYNKAKGVYGITLEYGWCFYAITIILFMVGIICTRRRSYHECN